MVVVVVVAGHSEQSPKLVSVTFGAPGPVITTLSS